MKWRGRGWKTDGKKRDRAKLLKFYANFTTGVTIKVWQTYI